MASQSAKNFPGKVTQTAPLIFHSYSNISEKSVSSILSEEYGKNLSRLGKFLRNIQNMQGKTHPKQEQQSNSNLENFVKLPILKRKADTTTQPSRDVQCQKSEIKVNSNTFTTVSGGNLMTDSDQTVHYDKMVKVNNLHWSKPILDTGHLKPETVLSTNNDLGNKSMWGNVKMKRTNQLNQTSRNHGSGTHLKENARNAARYQCNTCSKSFMYRKDLLRHDRVHTGAKPFLCSLCLKQFSRKDNLMRHAQRIHGKSSKDARRSGIWLDYEMHKFAI